MKNKTWLARLGAALLIAALLAGCGGKAANGAVATEEYSYDTAPMEPSADMAAAGEAGGLQSALQPQLDGDRKMVYTANVRLESKAFDEARDALLAAVDEFDAYIEYTDIEGSAEDGDRWLSYTVRVPVEHYTAFIAAVGEAGSVLSLNESADDITNSYIDVQARLDALEAQRDRLNELAAQAETTADLIEIEAQLSQVQYELESYTRQLRSMDNSVQYSTVDISLHEVSTYTPHNPTYLERLRSAFSGGWEFFIDLLQDLSVAVVYLFPTVLVVVLIVLLVRFITRKSRAERKAKNEAAKAARLAAREAAKPKPGPAGKTSAPAPEANVTTPAPQPPAGGPDGDGPKPADTPAKPEGSGPIYKH